MGVTQNAALNGSDTFSSTFNTATLSANGTPYTVEFSYGGDTDFSGATANEPLTVNRAASSFGGLVSNPIIPQGSPEMTRCGDLERQLPVARVCRRGKRFKITLEGITQNATLASNGSFSTEINSSSLTERGSPYTIAISYAGDADFKGTTGSESGYGCTRCGFIPPIHS